MLNKDYSQLKEYLDLEGTEISDYLYTVIELYEMYDIAHGMSEGFKESIERELDFWLERFETETEIVEEEHIRPAIPEKKTVIRTLVWNDE
jgi:hypothetical protein